MEINCPPALIASLKNKHLLLDANIFRDASVRSNLYTQFFNKLKRFDVTLATLDVVRFELLKGSANLEKYKDREKLIDDITDGTIISPAPKTLELVYELIKEYGIEGSALSLTDLFLGAALMQYKENLFLITRDTTDFIQNIFNLVSIVNVPHTKGIFTYGVYSYCD